MTQVNESCGEASENSDAKPQPITEVVTEEAAVTITDEIREPLEGVTTPEPTPTAAPEPPPEPIAAVPSMLPGAPATVKSAAVTLQQVLFDMPAGDEAKTMRKCAAYFMGTGGFTEELVKQIFDQNPNFFPPGTVVVFGQRFDSRKDCEDYLQVNTIDKKDGIFHWWPPMLLPEGSVA